MSGWPVLLAMVVFLAAAVYSVSPWRKARLAGLRRERLGMPAEHLAAEASRPDGDVVALGSVTPARDFLLERALTAQAADAAGVKCVVLTHFAESRAKPGPVLEPAGRDLSMEALEELADARNYLVWRAAAEWRSTAPDQEILVCVSDALKHVVRAFDATMYLHDRSLRRAA